MPDKKQKEEGKATEPSCKRTSIGGQALIEGLLMLGPHKQAIAIRKPDGEIQVTVKEREGRSARFKLPFLRGVVRLVTQMKVGISALMYSAEAAMGEEEAKEKEPSSLDRFADRHPNIVLTFTLFLSLGLGIALFILLPSALTDLIRRLSGFGLGQTRGATVVALSVLEGFLRIFLFLLYLWLTSRSSEIKRVWMYHGSEHKTIACYEAGLPLTVPHVGQQSRLHPRCGTSFLFLVMLVSILTFSLVGRYTLWLNIAIRLVLLPLIAGISYELIHYAGSRDNWLTRALSKPGLALQRLTTAEPDEAMMEVAIEAVKAVIPENSDDDKW
ncbi:MAG TPA: DUF1385 domain-containing protein [Bacillota bacterium]|jgi:uncharacterized protein YqhQ|nr:DUF1385 domain-containing protein [Fastidiosipila sp.]HPX93711.1 DUF1385 domain-containing protein [Bacillota bacterium]HQB81459.1 DUF1385 domain-containing protein [Bacillota bacterium]